MADPENHPPIPTSRDDLLVAALRYANCVSGFLNDLCAETHKELTDEGPNSPALEVIHDMLLRRFGDLSALHLFIAASNLRIELPTDLRGAPEDEIA